MTLVTRAQWGAVGATGSVNAISDHPVGVTIHYEGVNVGNHTHDTCEQQVRSIQHFHMVARGWSDIAYNYLACQHGYLFVGRGTGKGSAANGTTAANQSRYAVCGLIGPTDVPTPQLITAIGDGINLCRAAGAGKLVDGHRDLIATACPGGALYKLVQAGHWSGFVTPPHVEPLPVSRTTVRVSPKPAPSRVTLAVDGVFGVVTRKRLQQWAGVPADGILGPQSWKRIQSRAGAYPDGVIGPKTWRAVQRLVGCAQDGLPGPVTYAAVQRFLNTH